MTANRTRTGILALGLMLMILASAGCTSDGDVLSSGNVVTSMLATGVNPSSVSYACISIDYISMTVRPTDGICSAESDNAGRPCGTNADCTNSVANCEIDFGLYCDDGEDYLAACLSDDDCTDGACVTAGECISVDDMFTGEPCFSTADCDVALGATCGGACSPGSPLVGQACNVDGDCSDGICEGAQASDALQDRSIVMLADAEDAVAYFTPQCPRCDLDRTIPRYCTSDSDCENECISAALISGTCDAQTCCEKGTGTAKQPCVTDDDCENPCVDYWEPLPMNVLPEGRYDITAMTAKNLRMFAPGAVREVTECISDSDVANQFDPPLSFTVGPGQPNDIRSVIDIQALEAKLGLVIPATCTVATQDYPAWFQVVSE